MAQSNLSRQVDAYNSWKNQLITEIGNYQVWLKNNDFNSDDVHQRLLRGLNLLQEDQLTIAFVGEYSRGKTELINALIFAGFGQRMLPSQAGRTTMCPTEIFYDHDRAECYLRLLPIDTRLQDKSIVEFKTDPTTWHEIELDPDDPEKMNAALQQVASTRIVTIAEARSLGFDETMLEHATGGSDLVVIPVWRHAMISMDSSLLKRGLRILDTPGLNALGSEPELTISMIPKAQAVIFVLSADAGVTASDLAIWNDCINTEESDHRAGRFAVLNKIDVLWDDLQGDSYTAENIARVRESTAGHLKIAAEDVIPLSAKQGLIGRVKNDEILLQKSALLKLEKLISERVLVQKEILIHEELVDDVVRMLQSSQTILNDRLTSLYDRYDEFASNDIKVDVFQELAGKTHKDHDHYYKKLLTLKSSRRLMQSQGEILQQLVSEERLEEIIAKSKSELHNSWSTLGMSKAMDKFFTRLERDIDNVCTEAKLADKMVNAIYQRFTIDISTQNLKPKTFSIASQRKSLKILKAKCTQFRQNPKLIVTEQTIVIKRFNSAFVAEARSIHQKILQEAKRWPDEALLPLMQYTLEQKKMLATQVSQLRERASNSKDAKSQQEQLKSMIDETHAQLSSAERIEQQLREPPPSKTVAI